VLAKKAALPPVRPGDLIGVTRSGAYGPTASPALFVSHGDFYAQTVVERLGVEALIRVGCACYTSDDEIERLLSAVEAIAARR